MIPAGGPVVGSANGELVIDRMSGRIEQLIGEPANALVGRPLFEVVVVDDMTPLLSALAKRPDGQRGVRLPAKLRGSRRLSDTGELVVLPTVPVASCVFAFAELPAAAQHGAAEVLGLQLRAASQPAAGAGSSRAVPDIPGAERLSGREREIVERLLGGDRVPTIARQLYLSQSTVRNRLSGVYRKFGVNSQQQLIDLYRHRYGSSGD